MTEFKDRIPAATGKIEFLYEPATGIVSNQISGEGFISLYFVAISLDGRRLLCVVPAPGLGQQPIYLQPSILTYVQSDSQGMWGRNCPSCRKYFRTTHVFDPTHCPYCSAAEPGIRFVSQDQRVYIRACYDAFARAHLYKRNVSLDIGDITDAKLAWHYSEEKLQLHFVCETPKCGTQTDVLGEYAFCPRCGRSNARKLFLRAIDAMIERISTIKSEGRQRSERNREWRQMTQDAVALFEPLAHHLRNKLLRFPMTPRRLRDLKELNF